MRKVLLGGDVGFAGQVSLHVQASRGYKSGDSLQPLLDLIKKFPSTSSCSIPSTHHQKTLQQASLFSPCLLSLTSKTFYGKFQTSLSTLLSRYYDYIQQIVLLAPLMLDYALRSGLDECNGLMKALAQSSAAATFLSRPSADRSCRYSLT